MVSLAPSAASAPEASSDPLVERVRRSLAKRGALPALPAAALELTRLAGDERADARALSEVIHRDQALAAAVLRVANSSAFAGVATIVSLQQAVARLGGRMVAEIALAVCVEGALFRGPRNGVATRMWRTALATGLWCKEIARLQRTNVEAAFLCGLLHDVGAPLVLQALPVKIGPARTAAVVHHLAPEASASLARAWNMPARVVAAAAHHRDLAADEHRHDVAVVALGRLFAEAALDRVDPSYDHPAVIELHLYDDELATLWSRRDAVRTAAMEVGA